MKEEIKLLLMFFYYIIGLILVQGVDNPEINPNPKLVN